MGVADLAHKVEFAHTVPDLYGVVGATVQLILQSE